MKVGLELFTAVGPEALRALNDLGCRVFLDARFHNIPNTVAGACRSPRRLDDERPRSGRSGHVGGRGARGP
jgi:orotidine-5'-phosphate decarboxylase